MCHLCNAEASPVPDGLKDAAKRRDLFRLVGRERRHKIHRGVDYKVSERTLRAEWGAIEAQKQESEGTLNQQLRKLFENQISRLLDALREKMNVKKLATAAAKPQITPFVVSNLLNWQRWFGRTGDVAREPIRQIIESGYQTGNDRLAIVGPDFTSDDPFVTRTLNDIVFQTQNVQNTFRETVEQEIQRGLVEGEDIPEIIERVAGKTQEQTGYRLRRTVRTASNGGFEAGQVKAYRDAGMNEMRWLSQRDGRVRSPSKGDEWNHRDPDGQTVKVNTPFTITGRGGKSESLPFPSHPSGSPGNVINCRCSTRPVS